MQLSDLTPESQVIQSMFYIQDKQGRRIKYDLNPSQIAYDKVRTKRDIIAKARQKGFSSFGIALQCVDCLGKEGTRAVLISHEATATQRLLDKARYYLQYLEGPSPELGRHSRNEFYFPRTESTFYIGTAGAKAFGRGDTINHLHISEYAWWESDALEKVAGLFQAVPMDGTIRIESTGNGRTNDFYYMCMHAVELGYNIFFRAWWEDDEYQMQAPDQWVPRGFENYFQDMRLTYQLSENQLYWYWCKLGEFRLNLKYMQQEYPSSLEECFQASGGSVFPNVSKAKSFHWQWKMQDSYRVEYHDEHPRRDRTYVLGADAAGGTGNDEAAIQIICMETFEQVYEFGSNQIDPVAFGRFIVKLAREYNEAFIVSEGNNHGIATNSIIKQLYADQLMRVYKEKLPSKQGKIRYGFQTSENSKKLLVGAILESLDSGLSLYGQSTHQEMQEFEEHEGKMGAPQDGKVISLGMACVGYFKYKRFATDLEAVARLLEKQKRDEEERQKRNYMFYTFEDLFKDFPNPKGRLSAFQDQIRRT